MFLHVNLCILIRIEEKDKNVDDFTLQIKEFKKKLVDTVKYSWRCGFREVRGWEWNCLPFEGRYGKALNNFGLVRKNKNSLKALKRTVWRKHGIMSRIFYFVIMKTIMKRSLNYNLNTCLLSRDKENKNLQKDLRGKTCSLSKMSHHLVWLWFIRSFLLTTFGNYSSHWYKISLDNPNELLRKKCRTNSNFTSWVPQMCPKVENPVVSVNRDGWKWQKLS